MELGYEIDENQQTFEKPGFTGEVTRYSESSLEYPCIIVQAGFEKYKLDVLKTMLQRKAEVPEGTPVTYLYFEHAGNMASVGHLTQEQVKAVLDLFHDNGIRGYFDANTALDGDMVYVLM